MSMAEPAAPRDSASPPAGRGDRSESPGEDLLAPLLPAGEPVEGLLRKAQFFVPGGSPSPDFREVHRADRRAAGEVYPERGGHDHEGRPTHGGRRTRAGSW